VNVVEYLDVKIELDLMCLSKKRPVLTEAIEELIVFAEASSAVRQ
jgi:hypothetical protein